MRILYHHRTLADGAEGIHIAEMVGAFVALGHEVEVLGPAAPSPAGAPSGTLARLRRALPEAVNEAAGVAFNALEYRSVKKSIRARRPDLLYKRHARNDVGALSAARSAGVPSVLEVNCLYSSPSYLRFEPLTFRRVAASLERRALALATKVVAVSSPLADEIGSLGCTSVTVLPNGANPATFAPVSGTVQQARERIGLRDRMTLGWTGIIREWHGLGLLLDVLRELPSVQLLVVGDGPGRHAFETKAAELGVRDRVVVTGRVPHDRIAEYLAAVDVAVVADERTGIASPMKLLEYMAMGLTVVAPDAPNIRDLIAADTDGVLFTAGDAQALATAIGRLMDDARPRQRLGRNARLKIERERNWRRNAERVVELVADSRPPRAAADSSLKGQHV